MKTSHSSGAAHSGFLPSPFCAPLAGLDYYGESRPARDPGQDYFDFLPPDRHSLVCSIGKVNGSGISASFTMASLQAFLRGLTRRFCGSVEAVVSNLNRMVYEISPASFYASLFYGWIDRVRGRLHYVNAGHAPVLLFSEGIRKVRRLENTGTVLGLSLRVGYGERTVDLEQGDLLVALTDGVTDVFTEDEIVGMVERDRRARPADLVRRILDGASGIEDCTALAVRFKSRAASPVLEAEHAEAECVAA